jgi:hypothetical protein
VLGNRQLRSNRLDHLPSRGKDAQCRPGTGINNRLPVHEYLELAIGSTNQLYLSLQFAPQSRRHTDGVYSGHSIRTVVHLDSCHVAFLLPISGVRVGRIVPDSAPRCPPNAETHQLLSEEV